MQVSVFGLAAVWLSTLSFAVAPTGQSIRQIDGSAVSNNSLDGNDKEEVRQILLESSEKLKGILTLDYLKRSPRSALVTSMELLQDEAELVRKCAAGIIEQIVGRTKSGALIDKTGIDRDDVAPSLLKSLHDENIDVRVAVARALCELDEKHAEHLIAPAIDALHHHKINSGEAVRWIQSVPEKAIPELITAMDTDDASANWYFGATAASVAHDSLDELARGAEHASSRVRARVAFALGYHTFRDLSHEATTALTQLLRDEDAEVRLTSAESIVGLKAELPVATVPVLIQLLTDTLPKRRLRAAAALGVAGTTATQAVPMLLKTLDDDSTSVRVEAAISLISIDKTKGPATWSILSSAIEQVGDMEFIDRQRVLRGMLRAGELGADAVKLSDSIVGVINRCDTNQGRITIVAAETLVKIDATRSGIGIRALSESLGNPEAVLALVRYQHLAKPAVNELIDYAKRPKRSYRELAAAAAAKIEPENHDVWKLLRSAFDNSDKLNKGHLLKYLVEFDVTAGPILDELAALTDSGKGISNLIYSAKLIGKIGPDASRAVPALQRLSDHENELVREAVTSALSKIQHNDGIETGK